MNYKLNNKYILGITFVMFNLILITSLKILNESEWPTTFDLFFNIFIDGDISLNSSNNFLNFIVFLIAFYGATIQLGFIVLILNFVIARLIANQDDIFDKLENIAQNYNFRKIFPIYFTFILFTSVISFKIIENLSWLDSIYFTIVTITTVGFGDISPTYPITKFITLVLVAHGISFIALGSQIIINRIVNLQLTKQNSLPSSDINFVNHIIIGGFGSKGRRLAQLFKERGYEVVIVEIDQDRARVAEISGYYVLNTDITKPTVMEILSLNNCSGLFLLPSNDNLVLQTGIIAKSISSELDIYAEFLSAPTYEISRYAGINKPISLFVFLTNVLQNYFTTTQVSIPYSTKDLRSQESTIGYIEVPSEFNYSEFLETAQPIGFITPGLNELYLHPSINNEYEKIPPNATNLLIFADREELDNISKEQIKETHIGRLIFAGYSELVDSLIQRLDVDDADIVIFWDNPEEEDVLANSKYQCFKWEISKAYDDFNDLVKDGDLIISTFDDMTSSLVLGVTIKNLKENSLNSDSPLNNTQLIQLVPYEYDKLPLMKIGAEIVYSPQEIISHAFLNSFLKENNISPSMVYTNGHVYEHFVLDGDIFDGKHVSQLKKDGFNIIYFKESDQEKFDIVLPDLKVKSGYRLIVHLENALKE